MILRSLLLALLVTVCAGCAGSRYYAPDRQQDNTDYANRMDCPGDTMPICEFRGDEVVQCRCASDSEIGDIF
jgi:hypothetical protein